MGLHDPLQLVLQLSLQNQLAILGEAAPRGPVASFFLVSALQLNLVTQSVTQAS